MAQLPKLFRMLQADDPDWVSILSEVPKDKAATQFVHPTTNLTPLHLATMFKPAQPSETRVAVVRALLGHNLDAAHVPCQEHGYTPLMYACIVNSLASVDAEQPIVKLILEMAPLSFRVTCKNGNTAFNLHISCLSRLHQLTPNGGKKRRGLRTKEKQFAVARTLLDQDIGERLPTSVDHLFRCNATGVLEYLSALDHQAFICSFKPDQQKHLVAWTKDQLSRYWLWDMLLEILRSEHGHTYGEALPLPPFNALHTAAQIPNFSVPFLRLLVKAYPDQLRRPSVVHGDYPLHAVAAWQVDEPHEISRKCLAISALFREYPQALSIPNNLGQTPLDLVQKNQLPWKPPVHHATPAATANSGADGVPSTPNNSPVAQPAIVTP